MTPHPQFPFTLSGSPYRDHFEMRGAPLQPDDLFETLDLTYPGLETVRAAVEAGDRAFNHAQAAQALLDYFRARRSVAWPAWVERAGRLLRWVEDDGRGNSALIVQNDSYPGLIHRRAVFFIQRRYFVLIDDALPTETPAGGAIDLHFQFAPGPVVIDPPARTARTAYTDGVNLLVWIDPRAPVTMEIEEAWFSPEHNQKEPMPAFRLRHAATQPPARFVTALIPWQDAPLPAVSVTVLETATGDDFAGARAQLRVNEALFEVG